MTATSSVQIVGNPHRADRVAFVRLLGAESTTRVRYRLPSDRSSWRCDACGRGVSPTCPHARAIVAHYDTEGVNR